MVLVQIAWSMGVNNGRPHPVYCGLNRMGQILSGIGVRDQIFNEILNVFENAERLGAEKDEPEGTRYIQISETLVNQFISRLRA